MRSSNLRFLQHLEEARNRVVKCIILLAVNICLAYQIIPALLPFLVKPVRRLVFLHPIEAFTAKISLAFWVGMFFSSPFFLYQIWQFISKGLTRKEKRDAGIFGGWSFALFIGGASFGYFLAFPAGLKFLLGFSDSFIVPMITVSNYISFLGMITFLFGGVFQFPLAIIFLVKIGAITLESLSSRRREVIAVIFIAAAVLTPPDVFTQILLAVPLVILYEISIIFVKIIKGTRDRSWKNLP